MTRRSGRFDRLLDQWREDARVLRSVAAAFHLGTAVSPAEKSERFQRIVFPGLERYALSQGLTLGTKVLARHEPLNTKTEPPHALNFNPDVVEPFSDLAVELIVPPKLVDFDLLSLPTSEIALAVSVQHFVFDLPKGEHATRSLLEPRQSRNIRLEPVERPPLPPDVSRFDLESMLALLLAPPVSTLLTDPQLTLPDRPFKFQLEGIQWLYDRQNALLADEMGLGKTMQAILAARLLWKANQIRNVLVICPKYLIPNWRREIKHWWPQAADHILDVNVASRRVLLGSSGGNYIFKLLNYEAVQREVDWLERSAVKHDLVIIDEAQAIKNAKTKTARAAKLLRGNRNWALTGTPLENRVDDLVSIFEFVRPGTISGVLDAPRKATYFLRRRLQDVGLQLPELVEEDVFLDLEERQRQAYDRAEEQGVIDLNAKGDAVTATHVFALIMRLQQLCNFDTDSGESAKANALLEDLEEIAESGRKALVFSQFVDDRYGLKRLAKRIDQSFRSSGRYSLQYHGEISDAERQSRLRAFQSDDAAFSLLLNYRTGGTGLNLQAASYVYLFNRWWNPAVEEQAMKRAHRIGQDKKVIVRRFVCRETIEERIVHKLAEKRRLFREIIDEGRPEQGMGLSEEELFSLFNLSVRPKGHVEAKGRVPLIWEQITWRQFEELVASVYEALGYSVTRIGGAHDGGIDAIAERTAAGGMDRLAIQCKHHAETIGPAVVRELWGTVSHDPSITHGVLVTSSSFSRDADAFARGKRIRLIEGGELKKLAYDLGVAEFPRSPAR